MKTFFYGRRKMQKERKAKVLFRQKKIRQYAGFSTITYEIFV
jgi:hypothetical protein